MPHSGERRAARCAAARGPRSRGGRGLEGRGLLCGRGHAEGAWPGGRSAAWRRVAPRHQRPQPGPAPPCRPPAPITWRPGGRPGCTGCPTAACACSPYPPPSTRGTPNTSRYGPRSSCPPLPWARVPPSHRAPAAHSAAGFWEARSALGGFAHRHKQTPAPRSDRFHPARCRHKARFFPGRARSGPAVNPGASGTPGTPGSRYRRTAAAADLCAGQRSAIPPGGALRGPRVEHPKRCPRTAMPSQLRTHPPPRGTWTGTASSFPLVTVPWEAPPPSTPQRLFPESLCEPRGVPFPSAVAAFLRLGVRRLPRPQPPLPHRLPDLLLLLQAGPGARRQAAPLLLCHLDGRHRRAYLLVRGAATVPRAAAHRSPAHIAPGQPRGPIPLPPSH